MVYLNCETTIVAKQVAASFTLNENEGTVTPSVPDLPSTQVQGVFKPNVVEFAIVYPGLKNMAVLFAIDRTSLTIQTAIVTNGRADLPGGGSCSLVEVKSRKF
jgi:hypothetical protein